MNATNYEQLSSKILVMTISGLLLSCIPILFILSLFQFITMKSFLFTSLAIPVLAGILYFTYKQFHQRSIGKFYISANSFFIIFVFSWFIPSYEIWSVIVLYMLISLLYLNRKVMALATLYGVIVYSVHWVLNPYFDKMQLFDHIVSYVIILMIGVTCYSITIMGNRMLHDVQRNESKVTDLLQEITSSIRYVKDFGKKLDKSLEETNGASVEIAAEYREISQGAEYQASGIVGINEKIPGTNEIIFSVAENSNLMKDLSISTSVVTKKANSLIDEFGNNLKDVFTIQTGTS